MPLKLFNTMSGKKEDFVPLQKGKIGMYVCGPTVYDHPHIGHGRVYVCFDAIYRYLKFRFNDYKVTYVRNITDVDDKIIKKANESGRDFTEVAKEFSESFWEDTKNLGLLSPDIEPKASEMIPEMQKIIKSLIEKGMAYENNGDVYYSVDKFNDYGKLSKRKLDDMEAGARVEVSKEKKNPMDFALWKAAKEGEPSWPSDWGNGRPGWHIECSAMSAKYLGETFDIHGGGKDLVFPHHENEIAQSEGFSGKPFVKFWLHNGFLNLNKEKMSKSLGNVVTIKKLLEKYSAEALKLFILQTHYRSPIDFSDDLLTESEKAVCRVYAYRKEVINAQKYGDDSKPLHDVHSEIKEKIEEAMNDDFNTAKALGIFFDSINKGYSLLNKISSGKNNEEKEKSSHELKAINLALNEFNEWLGLFGDWHSPDSYLHCQRGSDDSKSAEIEKLIEERVTARKNKDFKKADEVRDKLLNDFNVELEDKKDGTRWKYRK